jgi:hypothetical protein
VRPAMRPGPAIKLRLACVLRAVAMVPANMRAGGGFKGQIAYQPLKNGIRSCANPKRLQAICDSLSADRIDMLLRKWFRGLLHPFPA